MNDRDARDFAGRSRADAVASSPADHPRSQRGARSCSTPAADSGRSLGTKTASADLLGLLGHTESCIALIKAGSIASCDCRTAHMEDPAIAVEVTRHYARTAIATGSPIPTVILELLTCHVMDGNPACIELAEWLDASGLLDLGLEGSDDQETDP